MHPNQKHFCDWGQKRNSANVEVQPDVGVFEVKVPKGT